MAWRSIEFQLPITHESTAKYTHLSDIVLKRQIKDCRIIYNRWSIHDFECDTYVNLQFYQSTIMWNLWYNRWWFLWQKIHFLFRDLLELPPVREQSPFVKMSRSKIHKYLGIMDGSDLWRLFDYDKLLINIRQRCDNTYRDILSGIQIGLVMDSDINVLQSKKIHFKGSSCDKRLNLHLYKSITSWYNIFTHVLFVQGFKHGNAQ